MSGGSSSLTFRLLGIDVSASRTLRDVGDEADRTARRLDGLNGAGDRAGSSLAGAFGLAGERMKTFTGRVASLGATAAKLTTLAQSAAAVGQMLAQAGAAAGVAAPALLAVAQAQGTLKLLSGAASEELKTLTPQIDRMRTAAEGAFRPEFAQAVRTFGSNLPVVSDGVRETAKVFGELSVEASKVFSGPAFRKDLADLMKVNTGATRDLGRAGIWMAGAFWDVAIAAKGVWASFAGATESGARQLAQWVEAKRESGALTAAIQRGADSIADIVGALWNFGAGIKSLFGAIAGDSAGLSSRLHDMSVAFRGWAESASVVDAVSGYFTRFRQAVSFARDGVVELAREFTAGFDAGRVSGDASGLSLVFQTLGVRAAGLATLFRTELWPTIQRIGTVITNDLLPIVSRLSVVLSDTLFAAVGTVARIIRNDLIPVGESLAPILRDVLLPAITSLAGWLKDNLFPAVERVAGAIRDSLKPAFDGIYNAIMDNKEELKLLWTALGDIASVILNVVEWALKGVLKVAIEHVSGAIGFVIEALAAFVRGSLQLASAVLGVALEIIGGFRDIVDAALGMVSGVVGAMSKLPGPLGAPWRAAQEAVATFRTNVNTDLTTAEGRVLAAQGRINGFLDGIRDKTVTLTVIEQRRMITEYQTYSRTVNGPAAYTQPDHAVTKRASGGPVRAGMPYLVGERGREMFFPQVPGWIANANATARMLAGPGLAGGYRSPGLSAGYGTRGGGTTVVNQYITVEGSVIRERELAESIAPRVRNALNTRFSSSNGGRT